MLKVAPSGNTDENIMFGSTSPGARVRAAQTSPREHAEPTRSATPNMILWRFHPCGARHFAAARESQARAAERV